MCLVLPARVIAVNGEEAELELHGGMRVNANISLKPEVVVGQFVLMDRGLVLEIIEPAEAEAIIAMYEEIGQLLDDADSAHWPAPVEALDPVLVSAREARDA